MTVFAYDFCCSDDVIISGSAGRGQVSQAHAVQILIDHVFQSHPNLQGAAFCGTGAGCAFFQTRNRGCAYRAKDGTQGALPGRNVTVTDTIGAGDTHAGVTLGCLSRNLELTQALTLANAAAAYTVTRSGADLPESLDVVL